MHKYCVIIYVPNPVAGTRVAIGVLAYEDGKSGFVGLEKRTNWEPVRRLDPDVDVEFLQAALDHIADLFRIGDEGRRRTFIDQLSTSLQLTEPQQIEDDDPREALMRLARVHLG